MKTEELTEKQRSVVQAQDRALLVLGGPGSGKTTTALWAARFALSTLGPENRILFLTFSRTAVSQIAKASPSVLAESHGRIEVFTFHGLAWRLVRAFGRYAGSGALPPAIQSQARMRLLGRDSTRLVYDDLLPAAGHLLRSSRLRSLLASRWPLVICDEFQDTDDEQWKFIQQLSSTGRLVLLCDPNQMIYTFLRHRGVGPKRLEDARASVDRTIELESASHRDPSGIIPAMAEAVLVRDFSSDAISRAVTSGTLKIIPNTDEVALPTTLAYEVQQLREEGAASIGIFGHSNVGVAELAAALASQRIDHVLIGISEAVAEALNAIGALCKAGLKEAPFEEARAELACFLTACVRGREVPPLARALMSGDRLPEPIAKRLAELETSLTDSAKGTVANLVSVACNAWQAMGIGTGLRPWKRAVTEFVALSRSTSSDRASPSSLRSVFSAVQRKHSSSLIEMNPSFPGPVQLMNFYQTKGREANAVILAYREGDYLANAGDDEPYEESSRVLYVSLTRAQTRVTVVLPPNPHPLVAPFADI